MASQLALFGIVVGIALLLTGIGFGILAVAGALRSAESPLSTLRSKAKSPAAPVPSH
jgi:F0F1-type ATP synthase membrane subunit c/vacuolar-type H+-ATPase subunit K